MIPVPEAVLESFAQTTGSEAAQLQYFGGGHEASDGIVYAFPYQGSRRLLKIMALPEDNQQEGLFCLEERLKFVRYLGENGAPVVYPQFSPQGNLYETLLYDQHVWIATIMELIPGRVQKEKSWNPAFFQRWGQAVGTLHRLARQYPSWLASENPESGKKLLTWQEEWQSFHDWCPDEAVKLQWVAIKAQLEALPVERDSFGFIHNDPHIWNVLADGERLTLLDFDVANHHWFVNDIAIACQNILIFLSGGMNGPIHNRDKLLRFLALFLEGYNREHQLASNWLDRLDLFIAYRRILLFIVMNDWVRAQPKLHQSWKQMILSEPEIVGSRAGSDRLL